MFCAGGVGEPAFLYGGGGLGGPLREPEGLTLGDVLCATVSAVLSEVVSSVCFGEGEAEVDRLLASGALSSDF